MINEIISKLLKNPQDALAVYEGRAVPLEKLSPKDILEVVRGLSKDKESLIMKYWV